MKVVISGATGSVGRLMVTQALREGHTVTALARDLAKLSSSIRTSGSCGETASIEYLRKTPALSY